MRQRIFVNVGESNWKLSPAYSTLKASQRPQIIHHLVSTTENSKQMLPEMKLRGLVPNSSIHVSAIYSHDWSAYFAAAKEMNRS
jgi:hypothetical protein